MQKTKNKNKQKNFILSGPQGTKNGQKTRTVFKAKQKMCQFYKKG